MPGWRRTHQPKGYVILHPGCRALLPWMILQPRCPRETRWALLPRMILQPRCPMSAIAATAVAVGGVRTGCWGKRHLRRRQICGKDDIGRGGWRDCCDFTHLVHTHHLLNLADALLEDIVLPQWQ